jgi:hypothetical protein
MGQAYHAFRHLWLFEPTTRNSQLNPCIEPAREAGSGSVFETLDHNGFTFLVRRDELIGNALKSEQLFRALPIRILEEKRCFRTWTNETLGFTPQKAMLTLTGFEIVCYTLDIPGRKERNPGSKPGQRPHWDQKERNFMTPIKNLIRLLEVVFQVDK